MREKSQIISGFHAVQKALEKRPEKIQRLFFLPSLAQRFGSACKQLAADKKLYKTTSEEELEKLAKTEHHGGVVAFFDEPDFDIPDENTLENWKAEKALVIALDGLGNPHNVGAIIRSASFLGIKHLLIDSRVARFVASGAVARTAEGGLDVMQIWRVPKLDEYLLDARKKGIYILGTDMRATQDLANARAKRKDQSLILVMGNEEFGLSAEVRAVSEDIVAIEGSGEIESLNVVQAAGICMYVLNLPFQDKKTPVKKVKIVKPKM